MPLKRVTALYESGKLNITGALNARTGGNTLDTPGEEGRGKETMDDELRSFYNSTAWRRNRRWIMMRDGYMCQYCRAKGRTRPAEVVHHVKDAEHYPELRLTDANLVSLCTACHERIHRRAAGGEQDAPPLPAGVRVIKP